MDKIADRYDIATDVVMFEQGEAFDVAAVAAPGRRGGTARSAP
ncbi:MAG TPA: hypothetical protein VLI41_11795 [Phenylobacterium sp.]|nr:hypothetical protein [Phenylobacterium sp.]HSV03875.1 hypothetical protein [Phenylobacterium sp.]